MENTTIKRSTSKFKLYIYILLFAIVISIFCLMAFIYKYSKNVLTFIKKYFKIPRNRLITEKIDGKEEIEIIKIITNPQSKVNIIYFDGSYIDEERLYNVSLNLSEKAGANVFLLIYKHEKCMNRIPSEYNFNEYIKHIYKFL